MAAAPEIIVVPDPDAFVVGRTPALTYECHARFGWGWTLVFLDDADRLVEHFLGGERDDPDPSLEAARRWLATSRA
jgi:hypothetical protein